MLEAERLGLPQPNHRIPGLFGHACRGFGARRSIFIASTPSLCPAYAEQPGKNVTSPTAKTRARRLVAAAVSEPYEGGE